MFLTSLQKPANEITHALRLLSVIEGRVDWYADCDFMFYGSKGLIEHEKQNLQILQQYAAAIFDHDDSFRGSLIAKRRKAQEDHHYLRHLINQFLTA